MSMQMEFIKVLPSPQALMEDYPVSKASKLLKLQRDEAIKNILQARMTAFCWSSVLAPAIMRTLCWTMYIVWLSYRKGAE